MVKVNPEGKYVVDIDKDIDINKCTPNTRVALRNDSYVLHKILPTKVRGEGRGTKVGLLGQTAMLVAWRPLWPVV